MNRYIKSFLLLFAVIRSTSTRVCQIGSDSGVMGGETKLFCKVTSAERPDRGGTKWVGPHGDLILRGLVLSDYIGIIDIEMTIGGFYLIIKNMTKRDLGTYSCGYRTSPLSDCKLGLENFQEGPTTTPSTDVQDTVCQIGSDSGVMDGETKLFCKVTSETPDRGGTKWVGPHGDLILRGLVLSDYIGIIDIEMMIDGFYLIIKNTTKSDLGTYSCGYGTTPLSDCKLGLENFQGTTVAPSELNVWLIVLIVIFVMVVTFVPIVVLVYRFCFKNRTKDTKRCFAGLSSFSCCQCLEMEERTGVNYFFSPQEAVSGQDVTVTAVKKDTASEKTHEAGVDKNDIIMYES